MTKIDVYNLKAYEVEFEYGNQVGFAEFNVSITRERVLVELCYCNISLLPDEESFLCSHIEENGDMAEWLRDSEDFKGDRDYELNRES